MSVGYCPIPGMSQPRLAMTEDEKKRWLWRYRGSLEKEKALRADLQEQESRAVKTTAALTGMPGGGGPGSREHCGSPAEAAGADQCLRGRAA